MMPAVMPIPKEGFFLSEVNIQITELVKEAKYMGYWSVRAKNGGWTEMPIDIFYQPKKTHPDHSDYFGIFKRDGKIFICDGASAFAEPIRVLVTKDGKVLVSRYVHNYVGDEKGSFVDGGREYMRSSVIPGDRVGSFTVKNGEFVFEGFQDE